jgi:hypothetical protein
MSLLEEDVAGIAFLSEWPISTRPRFQPHLSRSATRLLARRFSLDGNEESGCDEFEGNGAAPAPGADAGSAATSPELLFASGVSSSSPAAENHNRPGEVVVYHSKWLTAMLLKSMDHGYVLE